MRKVQNGMSGHEKNENGTGLKKFPGRSYVSGMNRIGFGLVQFCIMVSLMVMTALSVSAAETLSLFPSVQTMKEQSSQILSQIPLSGSALNTHGDAVTGIWAWTTPDMSVSKGLHKDVAYTFTPADLTAYAVGHGTVSFLVASTDSTLVQFTINIGQSRRNYNGLPCVPVITTTPANIPYTLTWKDGLTTAPTATGHYRFSVMPNDTQVYAGYADGVVDIFARPILDKNVSVHATPVTTGETLASSQITGVVKNDLLPQLQIPGIFAFENPSETIRESNKYSYTFTPSDLSYKKYKGEVNVTVLPTVTGRAYVTTYGSSGIQDGKSWKTAYSGSAGLVTAVTNPSVTEIWVAGGTYALTSALEISTTKTIYGGFAGNESAVTDRMRVQGGAAWDYLTPTVLKKPAGGHSAVLVSGLNAVLDGLTVDCWENPSGDIDGLGIKLSNNGETVRNCKILNARTNWSGGGIFVNEGALNCRILNNYITNCEGASGAGIEIRGSETRIEGCTVTNNKATFANTYGGGGGIRIQSGTGNVIDRCVISKNTTAYGGGGIATKVPVVISNCVIAQNKAASAFGGIDQAGGLLTNCLVVYNAGDWGSGVHAGASLTINFCTIAYNNQNNADDRDIHLDNCAVTLKNSIVVGSATSFGRTNGSIAAENNVVGGTVDGVAPTGTNRVFAGTVFTSAADTRSIETDWTAQNFKLASGSMCLNTAGADATVFNDLDGYFRPMDGGYDVGAYETQSGTVTMVQGGTPLAGASKLYVTFNGANLKNGSSWENALPGAALSDTVLKANNGLTALHEVHIAAGTYVSPTVTDAFTVPGGVKVYGGYPGIPVTGAVTDPKINFTVLTRAPTSVNTRVVNMAAGTAGSLTVLDGVSVVGGNNITNGAGILTGNYCQISHSAINSNTVTADYSTLDGTHGGAGICLFGANSVVDGCDVYNNNSNGSFGSGILAVDGGTVKNSIIRQNISTRHAAVSMKNGKLLNSQVLNNNGGTNAGNVNSGGGIYIEGASTVETCMVSGNKNVSGGGIFINGAGSIVKKCQISKNSAGANRGGGITINTDCTVSNCRIYENENTANSDGPGIYVGGGTATLENLLIYNNRNGWGSLTVGAGKIVGKNLTVCANNYSAGTATAGACAGLGIWGTGTADLTNCVILGNNASSGADINRNTLNLVMNNCVYGVANSPPTSGANNIQISNAVLTDYFTAPSAWNTTATASTDWHLKPGSHLIDAGTAANAPAVDLDNQTRPNVASGVCGIGAYEYVYPVVNSVARLMPSNDVITEATVATFRIRLFEPNRTHSNITIPLIYHDDQGGKMNEYIFNRPHSVEIPADKIEADFSLNLLLPSTLTHMTVGVPDGIQNKIFMGAATPNGLTLNAGKSVPAMDGNGYYLIKTDAQFDWFAKQLKLGESYNTLKAKIAGDFELETVTNLPIASFAGELLGITKPDGSKYKITVRNENYKQVFTDIIATGKVGGFIFEIPAGLGGTFDDNGLFIKNLYGLIDGMDFIYGASRTYSATTTTGLIQCLYAGTIRNTTGHLTAGASLPCPSGNAVGLLVGNALSNDALIENCTVYIDGALGVSNVGGIVGYGDDKTTQMRNCLVKVGPGCTITMGGTCGGLAGANTGNFRFQNCWYLYDDTSSTIPKQATGGGNPDGTFRIAYNKSKTVMPMGPFTVSEPKTGFSPTVLLHGSTADYTNFPGIPGYARLKDRTANHTVTSDLELSIAPEVAPVRFPYTVTSSSIPVDVNGAAAINSLTEWNAVSDMVADAQLMTGLTFRLSNAMTSGSSLKSIGKTAAPFCGTFECNIDPQTLKPYKITIDGAISNAGGAGGLFGHLGTGGILRQFNVELTDGGSVAGDQNYAGVLAGQVTGGTISKVNLLVGGTVSAAGGTGTTDGAVGGLAGTLQNASSVTECVVTLNNAALSLNSRNDMYTCIGGFTGSVRGGSTVTYSMVNPANVTFNGSGRKTENGLFAGRVNDTGSSVSNNCYLATEQIVSYPFNACGSASDGTNGSVRFYYGDIPMFITVPTTLIPGENWIVKPDPLTLAGFTASGAALTPPPAEGKYSGNVMFTSGDKLNFVLPYRITVYPKSVFDAKTRYVTVSGTAVPDGYSWETAYPKEFITTLLTDINVTKICLGGGTYTLSETLTVPAGKTIEGGYTVTDGIGTRLPAETSRLSGNIVYPWEFKTPTVLVQDGTFARTGLNMTAAGTTVDGVTVTKGNRGVQINAGSKLINSIVEDNQGSVGTLGGIEYATGVAVGSGVQSYLEKCFIFNNRQTANSSYSDHCAAGVATPIDGAAGSIHLRDCFIMKNKSAHGTGGITTGKSSSLTMINCVVANNETAGTASLCSGGIGRHVNNGNANTILNCTIAYNKTASTDANTFGGIALGNGSNMKNNIIWGNTGGAGQSQQTGSYNAIQNNTGAMINLDTDNINPAGPGFVNVAGTSGYDGFNASADWHVSNTGIPVNRGNNDFVNAIPTLKTDISGTTARIMNSFVDLGAYESAEGIGPISSTITVAVVNGAVTDAKEYYTTGNTILVSGTAPSEDKVFSHWTVNSGIAISESLTGETTQFIILGTENVSLTANYRDNIVRYVTQDGGAETKNGLTWETAADSTMINTMLTAADEVRFKTGAYLISSKMTFTTPKKMIGGYTGTGETRVAPTSTQTPWDFAEKTVFTSNGGRMFALSGGTIENPVHVEGITFTGAASGTNAEGAVFTFDNYVVLRDCVVRETSGAANNQGSAVEFNVSSNALVERSLFTRILGRDGMAIGIRGGLVNVDRCAFINNRQSTGAWGVVRVYNGTLNIFNSLFYQNAMVQGSCIYRENGIANVYQCTFAANGSSPLYGNMTTVQNSLFFNNASNGDVSNAVHCVFGSTPPAGVGNIQIAAESIVSPQAFVALTDNTMPEIPAADWQLTAASMAINRGSPSLTGGRLFDLNGVARMWRPETPTLPGRPDIGAYEYQGVGIPQFTITSGTSYTGSPIDLTPLVTSSPAGILCTVTGDGITNQQVTDAKTYSVTMTSADEQWGGSSQGTFTVYPKRIPDGQMRVTVPNTAPMTLLVEVQTGEEWIATESYTAVYHREDMSVMPAAPGETDYGKYFVVTTLTGNYTGTATTAFTVTNPLSAWSVSYEIPEVFYNAAVQNPLIVKAVKENENEKTLVNGTDYTVVYTHSVSGSHEAKDAGTYHVRVTIPAVSDKVLEQSMVIKPAVIADDEYVVENLHQFSDGAPKSLTVRLINGKADYPCVIMTDFLAEYTLNGIATPPVNIGTYEAEITFCGNYAPKTITQTLYLHDGTIRYVGNGNAQGDGLGYDLNNAVPFTELQSVLNKSGISEVRLGAYDYTITGGYTVPASKTLSGGWDPATGIQTQTRTRFIANARTFTMFTITAGTTSAPTTVKGISAESGQKAFVLNGNNRIENCRIFDMQISSGGGSAFNGRGYVIGCIIEKNLDNNNERGYIDNADGLTLVNCLIAHNENSNNGAAFGGTYTNCTFVGNKKAVNAYSTSEAGPTVLKNCLFWNNGEDVRNSSALTVTNSAFVKTGYTGITIDNTSNTSATAPKFAHVENMTQGNGGYHVSNDWSLLPTSYMINRGAKNAVEDINFDITGKDRIQAGYADLGAYESAEKGTLICTVPSIPNAVYSRSPYPSTPPDVTITGTGNENVTIANPQIEYKNADGTPVYASVTAPADVGNYVASPRVTEPQYWDVSGHSSFAIQKTIQTVTINPDKLTYEVGETVTFTVTENGFYPEEIMYMSVDGGELKAYPFTYTFADENDHTFHFTRDGGRNFESFENSYILSADNPAQSYAITCLPADKVHANKVSSSAGKTITVTASQTNSDFYRWTSLPAVTFADPYAAETTFVMPESPVTITAEYTVPGTIRYVTQEGAGTKRGYSWRNAAPFTELQSILETADIEVWIAGGEYNGSIATVNATIVRGGFAGTETSPDQRPRGIEPWSFTHPTTIKGNSTNRVFNFKTGMILDGVTLDGNKANYTISLRGGAIEIWEVGTVLNCIVQNTKTNNANGGGGIGIGAGGTVLIEGCLIQNNESANNGGGICVGTDPTVTSGSKIIRNCLISGNKSLTSDAGTLKGGAGLFLNGNADVSIEQTRIYNNIASSRGGAILTGGGTTTLKHVSICNNQGNFNGGGIRIEGATTAFNIYHSLIANNYLPSGNWGGGGIEAYGILNIYNSNIVNNRAGSNSEFGGGISVRGGTTTLYNSIVWGNVYGENTKNQIQGTATLYHCAIEGRTAETTNLNLNADNNAADGPNFSQPSANPTDVNWANAKWDLKPASILINGSDMTEVRDDFDLAGLPRTWNPDGQTGGVTDIGAYETQQAASRAVTWSNMSVPYSGSALKTATATDADARLPKCNFGYTYSSEPIEPADYTVTARDLSGHWTITNTGTYTVTKARQNLRIDPSATMIVSGTGVTFTIQKGESSADVTLASVVPSTYTETEGVYYPQSAGDYVFTFTQAGNGQYEDASVAITVSVTEKTVTGLTAGEPKTAVYNGKAVSANPATVTDGGTNPAVYEYCVTGSSAWVAEVPKKAGTYDVRISVAGDETVSGNTLIAKSNLVISPAELTVSGMRVAAKAYDGNVTANISYWGDLTGIIKGDDVVYVTSGGTATYETVEVKDAIVVTASGLSISGKDAANYTFDGTATAFGDILPLDETVTLASAYERPSTVEAVLSGSGKYPLSWSGAGAQSLKNVIIEYGKNLAFTGTLPVNDRSADTVSELESNTVYNFRLSYDAPDGSGLYSNTIQGKTDYYASAGRYQYPMMSWTAGTRYVINRISSAFSSGIYIAGDDKDPVRDLTDDDGNIWMRNLTDPALPRIRILGGAENTITFTVNEQGEGSAQNVKLNVWTDINGNGVFEDNEMSVIRKGATVSETDNLLTFTLPAFTKSMYGTDVIMRVRASNDETGDVDAYGLRNTDAGMTWDAVLSVTTPAEESAFFVTFDIGGNGSVTDLNGTPLVSPVSVEKGATLNYRITPANGYSVENILINQTQSKIARGDFALNNISRHHTVKVTFTNFPTIFITVNDGSEITSKEEYKKATVIMEENIITGAAPKETADVEIKGRGNSTWSQAKKPFRLKYPKAAKQNFFGMGEERNWVLLANYLDPSGLRNDVAFKMGRQIGVPFTYETQHVRMIMNGRYDGLYQLTEQCEVSKNRVNIGDDDWLCEFDTYGDELIIPTEKFKMPTKFKQPDPTEGGNTAPVMVQLNAFENAIWTVDKTNPVYESHINDVTFIDWLIVHMVAGNYEPKHPKSTYFHTNTKSGNGKITAGVLWDFDWAYGHGGNEGDFNTLKNCMWFKNLFQYPAFTAKFKARWNEIRPMLESGENDIYSYIDTKSAEIAAEQKSDYQRWNKSENFENQTAGLKNWLKNNIAYFDREINKMAVESYNVTVGSAINGTVSVPAESMAVGSLVTLTVTPNFGYSIAQVSYNDGTEHIITPADNIYSFRMPAKAVTVNAVFNQAAASVTLNASKTVAVEGESIDFTATVTPATTETRTVTVSYPELDWTGSKTITIPAGETSGTVSLTSLKVGAARTSEIKITAVDPDDDEDVSTAKISVVLNASPDAPNIRYVSASGSGYQTGWNAANAAAGADTIQKLIETVGINTIRIAGGTYTKATVPSQATAYFINRPISISGNWNETFTAQNATATPTVFTSTTTRIFTIAQTLTDATVNIDNINIRNVTHVPADDVQTNNQMHGMGILNDAVRTVLNVTNCSFDTITGAGVISATRLDAEGSMRITNCKFLKCDVYYAVISSHAATGAASLFIDRCEIRECSGTHTAAVLSRGTVSLTRTLIAKCKGAAAEQSGFIICRPDDSSSIFKIENCTLVQNEPSTEYISNPNSEIRNCVIWPNAVTGVPMSAFSRCAISNGTAGETVDGADECFYLDAENDTKFGPKFADPDNGIWTPLRGSVLINRGKTTE